MTTVTELLGNPESVGVWDLVPERSRITFRNKTMWGALRVHGVFTEVVRRRPNQRHRTGVRPS